MRPGTGVRGRLTNNLGRPLTDKQRPRDHAGAIVKNWTGRGVVLDRADEPGTFWVMPEGAADRRALKCHREALEVVVPNRQRP